VALARVAAYTTKVVKCTKHEEGILDMKHSLSFEELFEAIKVQAIESVLHLAFVEKSLRR
jgi:hypothetical protein